MVCEETELSSEEREEYKELETRIGRLKKDLEEEKERSNKYLERLEYLQAEFDNYKKVMDKKIEEYKKTAGESLILKLIDIYEGMEKCIENWFETEEDERLVGIMLIYDQLKKILKEKGLKEIESIGKRYDPFLHEVLSVEERDDCEEDTILEEFRRGYKLNSKVIRYSVVKVAKKPEVKENG
ncbi:MAG: heat shock protein GrpE [Candidatus Methanolliviera sp. GoM_oil]|nr:MAG: heat shock protein GrpE [Candidatus Methanolliviera sp. GoM_oil]